MTDALAMAWWKAVSGHTRFQPGSLDIENSALDVAPGGSVNLGVRLGARPRSDVTVAAMLSGNVAPGNEQTIQLPAANYTGDASLVQWAINSNRPAIDPALLGGGALGFHFSRLRLQADGGVWLSFAFLASGSDPDTADLSLAFETSGSFTVTVGEHSVTVLMAGMDFSDPYIFTPANSAEVAQFYSDVFALSGNPAGTLVLRDFDPTPLLTLSPSTRTFTRANWDEYEDFTLMARAGSGGNSPMVNLSASGAPEYSGVTGSATVTVT